MDNLHAAIMNLPCIILVGNADYKRAYGHGHKDARHAAAELASASAAESAKEIERLRAAQETIALDIAKWFVNGDRPDEWKLKEWAERLDRDAIDKAYTALSEKKA